MFAYSVRPEELCITNELISNSIKKNGDIEWRSEKEFLKYIEKNSNNIDWGIIGWVSNKTLKKWGRNLEIKDISIRNEEKENFWVLARGKEYWYVSTFVL